LLGWKIDIKSEEEKRQEVEQQMTAMSGATATPIEQVSELGESIIQKLVTAGITTVESLADMTPEQLEEIPGIGEKTLEKISVAVRHYFGQYEEGEERPAEAVVVAEGRAEAGEEKVADAKLKAEEASLDEEIDALKQDLTQSEDEPASEDGSGRIVDDVAEEQLAEITEVGPDLDDEGAESVDPGEEDTSEILAAHELDPELTTDDDAVLEGNIDEPKDAELEDKK
jgi:N utilization substance protein A